MIELAGSSSYQRLLRNVQESNCLLFTKRRNRGSPGACHFAADSNRPEKQLVFGLFENALPINYSVFILDIIFSTFSYYLFKTPGIRPKARFNIQALWSVFAGIAAFVRGCCHRTLAESLHNHPIRGDENPVITADFLPTEPVDSVDPGGNGQL